MMSLLLHHLYYTLTVTSLLLHFHCCIIFIISSSLYYLYYAAISILSSPLSPLPCTLCPFNILHHFSPFSTPSHLFHQFPNFTLSSNISHSLFSTILHLQSPLCHHYYIITFTPPLLCHYSATLLLHCHTISPCCHHLPHHHSTAIYI